VALNATVDEVLRVAAAEGIDADATRGGELTVATNAAQWARVQVAGAAEQRWCDTGVELLDADRARERVTVAGTRGAAWQPHAARVQPARLVAGLARAVEARGVQIHEGTRVTALAPGRVETDRGPVTARFVVRATEGFTARLPGERRTWLPMNSSLVVTAPLPEPVWQEIGWAGREVLGDAAHAYVYAQRTLTDLILGRSTALTRLPWVDHRVRRWEPEPLRWLGVRGLYAAYRAADRAEHRGRPTTSPLARIADRVSGRH
jgi:glycine/D-amino acid oxidase-like deaminating enzyme